MAKENNRRCGRCGWWAPDKSDDKWGFCEPPIPPWCDDGHAHLEHDCSYARDCLCYKPRERMTELEQELEMDWNGGDYADEAWC